MWAMFHKVIEKSLNVNELSVNTHQETLSK